MKKKTEEITSILKNANIDKYRAIPFWSWNDELEVEELISQIHWMKEQGFGGYFMHARGGLTTEYLGDDWFNCIKECAKEGDKLGMENWAYDENGWPSGFVGGKLLEEKENCDRYLTYTIGKFDDKAFVNYLIDGDCLVRTEETKKGEYLNVFLHYATSTVDILNPEVVDKFINLTHEEYKNRLKENFSLLKGFFTDEPQYQRWNQPYTKMIEKYFSDVYGEDVLDGLGLLFVEKKGYQEFRYKYWKGMQALMLENFGKKIYDWCESNGVELTGHYVEESRIAYNMMGCAGIMPFYMYEHIPGIDHLTVGGNSACQEARQVYSVAKQMGKNRVITESFGCCGWGATPRTFKKIAEKQFVSGVNLLCQHLLPYSEHGQRKRDYPAHFSWVNPWVRHDFKTFNDYFARLGYLLGESAENVLIAVFCPIRSIYLDYTHEKGCAGGEIDNSYLELIEKLTKMQIPFHIIDETVMEKIGSVKGNELIVGKCAYSHVIFPKTKVLGTSTKELFDKFLSGGGKMLFTDGVPTYLDGKDYEFNYQSNTTLDEILALNEFRVDDFDTEIKTAIREIDGKKFIYAVNLSEEKDYTLTFSGDFNGFISLDLETLKTEDISSKVHFEPLQSKVLFLSDKKADEKEDKKSFSLSGEFKVVSSSDNYLTLDTPRYSLDGVNYSEPIRYMGIFNELLNKRYSGDVYLLYTFELQSVPSKLCFLSEDMHNRSCKVNGTEVKFNGQSDFEKKIYKADIAHLVKEGENEIVLKINFYESEKVYYALFGENVTESLKNCLAYDTTIEACYLSGDFGVYSKSGFTDGGENNWLYAKDFYISDKKPIVVDLVKDGYPFFAGDITLEKTFMFGDEKVLELNGNFCLSEILLNGKKVEKSYFASKVDLTDYLIDGENTIRVTLWTGNQNLLGPHHLLSGVRGAVSPESFELFGTWKDGKSSLERDDYLFVRFGLFND